MDRDRCRLRGCTRGFSATTNLVRTGSREERARDEPARRASVDLLLTTSAGTRLPGICVAWRERVAHSGERTRYGTRLGIVSATGYAGPSEFGNAIRAPLGVHRATGKRYWFIGANFDLLAQLEFLRSAPRVAEGQLEQLLRDKRIPSAPVEIRERAHPAAALRLPASCGFQILDYVGPVRQRGRNYWTRCPSCADAGHDRAHDNLAISVENPRMYKCWAGCTKEMIRAALGVPPVRKR